MPGTSLIKTLLETDIIDIYLLCNLMLLVIVNVLLQNHTILDYVQKI